MLPLMGSVQGRLINTDGNHAKTGVIFFVDALSTICECNSLIFMILFVKNLLNKYSSKE